MVQAKHRKPVQRIESNPKIASRKTPETPRVTETLLSDMTRRIVDACDPEKIILFGSYAKGTARPDSDIDLFVIMKSKDELETNHRRIMNVSAAAKIPYLPMDVIVRTPPEVETRLEMGDFFIREIIDQGRVLYQRDAARRVDRKGRRRL
jgi:predicted nucleotidyltransferase